MRLVCVPILLGLVGLSVPVPALEVAWRASVGSAVPALPLVLDYNNDGRLAVLVATGCGAGVYVFDAAGGLRNRLFRPEPVRSDIASPGPGVFAFGEQAPGLQVLYDYRNPGVYTMAGPEESRAGVSLCFADIDGCGADEVVWASAEGLVWVTDAHLAPRWEFDAGRPLAPGLAAGPVFEDAAGVYAVARDGTLFALTGGGLPLWRRGPSFPPGPADAAAPEVREGPLLVRLAPQTPAVLYTDDAGGLHAVHAADGRSLWDAVAGAGDAGSPAVITAGRRDGPGGPELLAVTEAGDLALFNSRGEALHRGKLPDGRYVPRPLVADVDGDGRPEVVVAGCDQTLRVCALDGALQETVPLEGSAREGMVLDDLNADGRYELLAATDAGCLYCFTTRARTTPSETGAAWTHPRANRALDGCVSPLTPVPRPEPGRARRGVPRGARIDTAVFREYVERAPWSAVCIQPRQPRPTRYASAIVRCGETIVGSALKPLSGGPLTVPFTQSGSERLTLDLAYWDAQGRVVAASEGLPLRPAKVRLVRLDPVDGFLKGLEERAAVFTETVPWSLPVVAGRSLWHVVPVEPAEWARHGPGALPFLADAIPWFMVGEGDPALAPGQRAWSLVTGWKEPFFVGPGPGGAPAHAPETCPALESAAGGRFLGFGVPRWGDARPPGAGLDAFKAELEELWAATSGRLYVGLNRRLLYHQAYAWGAPLVYAEIAAGLPCTPLQLAFARGAARENGGRPWGVVIGPGCPGPDGAASPPQASLPDAGHDPAGSLVFRCAMAADLGGAAFVQCAPGPDGRFPYVQELRPGQRVLSPAGKAMRTWRQYSRAHPERGIPYTPIAFLVDFDRTPDLAAQDGFAPPARGDAGADALFRHVYGCAGSARAPAYLTTGPYGSLFDVLSGAAAPDALKRYAVVWSAGAVSLEPARQAALLEYVEQGGILVLDATVAAALRRPLPGIEFTGQTGLSAQVQTALGGCGPVTAPFQYREMVVSPSTGVLAWTGGGAPLLAWRPVGHGVLAVCAAEYWLDERANLLPLAPALLRTFVDALTPVRVTGPVDVMLNRFPDGWTIGLINNTPPREAWTNPGLGEPEPDWGCIIQFAAGSPLRFEAWMGECQWNNVAGGLYTYVPPGRSAVVRVLLSH